MFQYKIIHNILPTKVGLFRAKICDDDICPNVLLTGILQIIFFALSISFILLGLVQTWWTSKTKENVTLTESMILYGIFDNREHLYTLNYTLLIGKYSIYSSSLQEKKLCFDSFLTLLREKKSIYNGKLLFVITISQSSIRYIDFFCNSYFLSFLFYAY